MVHTTTFVSSSTKLAELIEPRDLDETLRVQFISLLVSIHYGLKDGFMLEFQSFSKGSSDIEPFVVKFKKPFHDDTKKSVLKLCSRFDIELPTDECYDIKDIHLEKLCLVDCKGSCTRSDDTPVVLSESLYPLDTLTAIKICENNSKHGKGLIISNIFDNLITMNSNSKKPFNFVKLENYDNRLAEFIQEKQQRSRDKSGLKNPIFSRPTIAADSINEFDSFKVSEANSSGLSDDPIEATDSSSDFEHIMNSYNKSACKLRKSNSGNKLETSRIPREYDFNIHIEYESVISGITGLFVDMYPYKFESLDELENCKLRLYFNRVSNSNNSENNEWFEIYIIDARSLKQHFGSLAQNSTTLMELLFSYEMSIDIKVSKHILGHRSLETKVWELIGIKPLKKRVNPTTLEVEMPITRIPSYQPLIVEDNIDKDPFTTFNQLNVNINETKYIKMIGLLVACTFENPSFVSLVFTDFTRNPLNQKLLFDRFLIDYSTKLNYDEGFRVNMYLDFFKKFDSDVKRLYGSHIKEMGYQNTENVSRYGILCKMSIKASMYNDRLSMVLRKCIPIETICARTSEENNSIDLVYNKVLKRIKNSSIKTHFENYSIAFPFVVNDHRVVQFATKITERFRDRVSDTGAMLPPLHKSKEENISAHHLVSTVIGIEYTTNHIRLMLTPEKNKNLHSISAGMILYVDIDGEMLNAFLNGKNNLLSDGYLSTLVGREITLKIRRTHLKYSGVPKWIPIHYTLEDLMSLNETLQGT